MSIPAHLYSRVNTAAAAPLENEFLTLGELRVLNDMQAGAELLPSQESQRCQNTLKEIIFLTDFTKQG